MKQITQLLGITVQEGARAPYGIVAERSSMVVFDVIGAVVFDPHKIQMMELDTYSPHASRTSSVSIYTGCHMNRYLGATPSV